MKLKSKLAALACCGALLLTGCEVKDVIKVHEAVSISFSWWGKDIRHSYTVPALKQFVQINPWIDVSAEYSEFDSFQKRMDVEFASHDECDVMQINYDWLVRYSPDGTGFYDLNQLSGDIALNNFTEEQLSYGMINGRLNGIPNALNTETCYYDREMYSRYGLEIPATWEDLFNAAKVMSPDGIYPLVLNRKAAWMCTVAHQEQISGKRFFNEDGSLGFTSSDVLEMLKFYKRLVDERVTRFITVSDPADFINGQAAGIVCWISDVGAYCDPVTEQGREIAVGAYLREPGSTVSGWYAKPTSLYCIRRDTTQPKAAAMLVDYLLNSQEMAEAQGLEKGIPLSKSMLEVLEAGGMLKGTQVEANDLLLSSPEVTRISPYLENAELVSSFEDCAAAVLFEGSDISAEAEKLFIAAERTAVKK